MLENKVKLFRVKENLTQEQLAEKVSCTRQTINSIEKNRYNPSLELALTLADVLNCNINEIFKLVKVKTEL